MTAENSRRTRTAKLKTANCQFASEQGEAHIINYQARTWPWSAWMCRVGSAPPQDSLSLCIDFPVFAVSRRLSFGHGKQLPCIQKYSKISMDRLLRLELELELVVDVAVVPPGRKVSWHGTKWLPQRTKSVMAHEKLPARQRLGPRLQDFFPLHLPRQSRRPKQWSIGVLLRSFGK